MQKKIVTFFMTEEGIIPITKTIETTDSNSQAKAIEEIIQDRKYKFYNLVFVLDQDSETYAAEYCKGLQDFQTRKHLIDMETIIKKDSVDAFVLSPRVEARLKIRRMPEHEWIDQHASGTLRKNKKIGFSYRSQYLAERVAYEFGYGFEIQTRSTISFGDPLTEENCSAITEAGWHIERYINLDIFADYVEAKYIYASGRDGTERQGVGMIVRETSAAWLPTGHIVFSIVAEFDKQNNRWKNAINPF